MTNDKTIITQLEKTLNIKLEQADRIDKSKLNKSYVLNNNNQVTGLCLNESNIHNLEDIIALLRALPQLQELNLWKNQISDIGALSSLSQLQELYLWDNQISDISTLSSLTQLQKLHLAYNKISDIGALSSLTQLQELDLKGNQISDISALSTLSQLRTLNLNNNQISDIGVLSTLSQLQVLYLAYNKISNISPLQNLKQLKTLNLSLNKIKTLPTWITEFEMEILYRKYFIYGEKSINLFDNPIQSPPLEIIKQGKQAIKNYFKSLVPEKTVKLNEVKVLLVGEGMAGKTSLLKQLQGLTFNKDESQTHGINVVTIAAQTIPGLENKPHLTNCYLHCWDFGGQEIMHASHQFFLSQRSLYILVLDSRTDSKKYHWLDHIQKFGGQSPIIVVMNKIDANPNYNLQQKELNTRFPTINNRFYRLSCQSGEGVAALIECLAQTIPHTSLFATPISQAWLNIKNDLLAQTQQHNYLNRTQFEAICHQHGVTDKSSQHTLLQFLHDLGIVLYFKNLSLANIYVLDPHWVTIGVYKIINAKIIKNGLLLESDLEYILNQEQSKKAEYDPARDKNLVYTPEEQHYILAIMTQFELAYEYNKQKRQYIIPDLLPKELTPEPSLPQTDPQNPPLHFIMQYDYLPLSLIARLMVRRKNEIMHSQQWRYGMILYNQDTGCQAKIKMDEQAKQIIISVQGHPKQKRLYFASIRHDIKDLNRDFQQLQVAELIPLPGYPTHLVKYQELLGYERAGKTHYFSGELEKEFPVSALLDAIISKKDREQEKRVKDYVEGSTKTFNIYGSGNVVQDDFQESTAKAESSSNLALPSTQTTPSLTKKELLNLRNKEKRLQGELTALENKQTLCQDTANAIIERQKRTLVATEIFIFIILAGLIFWFGWDVLEQWTFLAAGGLLILHTIISVVVYRRVYLNDGLQKKYEEILNKEYTKLGYTKQSHQAIKNELEQIEKQYSEQ